MASENINKRRLQELKGSDYEIADGQPDIRGWDVKDETGKDFGEVKELLFDETSRKVRYIILNLEDNDFNLESRKVLVPIGIATLHESDDDVILPGVTASKLQSLPVYEKDSFNPDSEYVVRNTFAGIEADGSSSAILNPGFDQDDTFYSHEQFNEENLYRNRIKPGITETRFPGDII